MIDTVVINLYKNQFELLPEYYNRFSPSVENFFCPPYAKFGTRKVVKADCNPSLADKNTGIYFPRLTLFKGVRSNGIEMWLRVEFSAPKIIFGNNFDELDEKDFHTVCKSVARRLEHFGVLTQVETIKKAEVTAIHYSKNIALLDYSKPSEIIEELGKSDINGLKDVSRSDFRNTGQAFKVHTNHHEFIVYDKIKDLMQSKKSESRSLSRNNECQLSLFEPADFIRPFEVIRLEARYGNKNEIKKLFNTIDSRQPRDITFASLFSQKISQEALSKELALVKKGCPAPIKYKKESIMEVYNDLIINNPDALLRDVIAAIGYKTLLKELGSRDIKTMAGKTSQEWCRFKKRIEELTYESRDKTCFTILESGLVNFKRMELKDYVKESE